MPRLKQHKFLRGRIVILTFSISLIQDGKASVLCSPVKTTCNGLVSSTDVPRINFQGGFHNAL